MTIVLFLAILIFPVNVQAASIAGLFESLWSDARTKLAETCESASARLVEHLEQADEQHITEAEIREPLPLESYAASLDEGSCTCSWYLKIRKTVVDDYPQYDMELTTLGSLPQSTVLGHLISDFDTDGEDELLVARWQDEHLSFEMWEERDGESLLASSMDAATMWSFPNDGSKLGLNLLAEGEFDISSNDAGMVFVQSWHYGIQGAGWNWCRLDYNHGLLSSSTIYDTAGSDVPDFTYLRSVFDQHGIPATTVSDDTTYPWPETMIVDIEETIHPICRITATPQADSMTYYNAWKAASDQIEGLETGTWSEPQLLGTLSITPD